MRESILFEKTSKPRGWISKFATGLKIMTKMNLYSIFRLEMVTIMWKYIISHLHKTLQDTFLFAVWPLHTVWTNFINYFFGIIAFLWKIFSTIVHEPSNLQTHTICQIHLSNLSNFMYFIIYASKITKSKLKTATYESFFVPSHFFYKFTKKEFWHF